MSGMWRWFQQLWKSKYSFGRSVQTFDWFDLLLPPLPITILNFIFIINIVFRKWRIESAWVITDCVSFNVVCDPCIGKISVMRRFVFEASQGTLFFSMRSLLAEEWLPLCRTELPRPWTLLFIEIQNLIFGRKIKEVWMRQNYPHSFRVLECLKELTA